MNTPSRRWLQFGLGTLFLGVTLGAVPAAREARFVHERQRVLRSLPENRVGFATVAEVARWRRWSGALDVHPDATIPFWRQWMGDEPIAGLWGTFRTQSEADRVRRLFPEAGILTHVEERSAPPTVGGAAN